MGWNNQVEIFKLYEKKVIEFQTLQYKLYKTYEENVSN